MSPCCSNSKEWYLCCRTINVERRLDGCVFLYQWQLLLVWTHLYTVYRHVYPPSINFYEDSCDCVSLKERGSGNLCYTIYYNPYNSKVISLVFRYKYIWNTYEVGHRRGKLLYNICVADKRTCSRRTSVPCVLHPLTGRARSSCDIESGSWNSASLFYFNSHFWCQRSNEWATLQ